jgi:chloramphenicol-sensitive protein RarD
LPVYFKLLRDVPALEIFAHRILWSAAICVVLIGVGARWATVRSIFSNRRRLAIFVLTTLLLSSNWLIYIYAVNTDRLLQTSLGYYINPLLSVVLGLAFLGERLRPWQWVAVALAAVGVTNQTWQLGELPWISLCLAGGFGAYGLIRKVVSVDALEGLTAETLLILPPALAYLA